MKALTFMFVLFFAAGWAGAPGSRAAETAPEDILARSDEARGNVQGIEWLIDIHSLERGSRQHRTLRVRARGYHSLAEFLSPAKVKGQKLLMVDRNMWFIKPGLRKPVPISPRQKLLGGASNGDIASTNYAGDYRIAHASEEVVDGEDCHVLDLSALSKKVTYDRIRYWISKKTRLGVRAEFYTVSGKVFKSATFEYGNEIQVNGSPRPFVSRMTITNAVMKEDVTVMDYRQVEVGEVPDSVFNLNLLVR